MLKLVRPGPLGLRILRVAPGNHPVLCSRAAHNLRQTQLPLSARRNLDLRQFSSIPSRSQEAAALVEDGPEARQEFSRFEDLAANRIIHPTVIDTITKRMNIHDMTEVQRMTLNNCLDGTDVVAQARTGTGKTLAFLLPIVQRLLRDESLARRDRYSRSPVDIRGLIVSPTRELAEQIAVEAVRLTGNTGIKVQTAVGGTGKRYHLSKMQKEGCHLLVGTPGRINDLLSDPTSGVRLDNIETFVLDEADRLLDIGFAPAIEEMQHHMPNQSVKARQTLMFSATVPKSVVSLVRQTMRPDFKFVRTIDPDEAPTHERIPQQVVYLNGLQNQMPAILEIAMRAMDAHRQDPDNALPFKAIVYFGATTQVNMAHEVFSNIRDPSQQLRSPHPLYPCRILRMNGGMTQQQRTAETQAFRRAESAILFSTDVTARGMDFPNVSHVIQIGLPRLPDDYIHRIGRTGRAGKPGEGWLLLNKDEAQDFNRVFTHQGIKMGNKVLESASLNMKQSAQLSANVAKMLQMIEAGVKSVPFGTKSSVYTSLLGVMQQQYPGRGKQEQIDMMNDLARYGWGMQKPPSLSPALVRKLGFDRVQGIELEHSSPFAGERRGAPDNRFGRGRRTSFDKNDPFGMGGGKGVFGGSSNDRPRGGNRRDPFGNF